MAQHTMAAVDRRLHLAVGRDHFLPSRLRVMPSDDGEFIFGEPQMHEVLSILQQVVPPRLSALLSLRTPSRESIDNLKGATLEASITFQPTSSSLWLLGSADRESDNMRSAVPYTLLCDVRPLTNKS